MRIYPLKKREKMVVHLLLFILAIIWIIPLVSAIEKSFYANGFQNYIYVFSQKIGNIRIHITFVNSFIIAIVKTLLLVIIASMAGYSFAKIQFPFKELLYLCIVACLAIPVVALIIPLFFLLTRTGLYNTRLAVILVELSLEIPFSVLMIRNYFDSLPSELMESAQMDGANQFTIFSRIYAPIAYPAMVNLGILGFMWSFKDFLIPSTFAAREQLTTATVAISRFTNSLGATPKELGIYNASLVIISIPIIIIFYFLQRYITSGITNGAIKG